jgi:hypothetical protein
MGFSAVMVVSDEADPLPPQRRVVVDRPASIFRKGADAPFPPLASQPSNHAARPDTDIQPV